MISEDENLGSGRTVEESFDRADSTAKVEGMVSDERD